METNADSESKSNLILSRAFFITHQDNITHCKAARAYTTIYYDIYEEESVSYNIKVVQLHLKCNCFVRVNKSLLVNKCYIYSISKRFKKLILRSGKDYKIARRRIREIISLLTDTNILLI
jgi:DNA-binding LytR/AlgR family response regulator